MKLINGLIYVFFFVFNVEWMMILFLRVGRCLEVFNVVSMSCFFNMEVCCWYVL